jgi:hypothetical protein
MTKHPQNVLPMSEILHSMTDKDFDQWLDSFPATDTSSLLVQYRKYAADAIAKGEDIILFNDWRKTVENSKSNVAGSSR